MLFYNFEYFDYSRADVPASIANIYTFIQIGLVRDWLSWDFAAINIHLNSVRVRGMDGISGGYL